MGSGLRNEIWMKVTQFHSNEHSQKVKKVAQIYKYKANIQNQTNVEYPNVSGIIIYS